MQQYQEGQRKRNPQTGQTATFSGGRWVLDQAPQAAPQAGAGVPQMIVPPQPKELSPRYADEAARSQAQAAAAQAEAPYAAGTAQANAAKALADARAAQANATKAEREIGAAPPLLSPQQRQAAREDAWNKIKLVRSIKKRITAKDGVNIGNLNVDLIPETGFLGKVASKWGGTNASGIAADLETLNSGGALAEVTRLMRETGKNPFTPMSNYESQMLAKGIGNLDLNQPQETLLRSLDEFEKLYVKALRGVGYKLKEPAKGQKPKSRAVAGGTLIEGADGIREWRP